MKKGAIMVGVSSRCRGIGGALAIAGFMLLSAEASAACQAQGCLDVKVTEIYMNSLALGFHVQTSGDETLANCTPISGILLTVPESTPHFKDLYSLFIGGTDLGQISYDHDQSGN